MAPLLPSHLPLIDFTALFSGWPTAPRQLSLAERSCRNGAHLATLRPSVQKLFVPLLRSCPRVPPPQVTLVGKVLSTNESGLTFGLSIDDGTGTAAVKIWISDDGEWHGKARRWQGKWCIS